MPINEVTVTNAQATQAAGTTYVDVRSTQEFEAGHPAGTERRCGVEQRVGKRHRDIVYPQLRWLRPYLRQ